MKNETITPACPHCQSNNLLARIEGPYYFNEDGCSALQGKWTIICNDCHKEFTPAEVIKKEIKP